MNKTLRELKIGTYDGIETASEETSIITALKKFVERRVSALPMIDTEGRLVDIFAKFDVIVSVMFFQLIGTRSKWLYSINSFFFFFSFFRILPQRKLTII